MQAMVENGQRHEQTQANLDGLRYCVTYCQLPVICVIKQLREDCASVATSTVASISTDPDYVTPRYKYSTGPPSSDYISEWRIFFALDHLRSTATGLDELPAWFLRLGAPALFYKPDAQLFNLSIASSTVPLQWKRASIRPVPKVTNPQILSDFRPISVTPVLTRIME